jgi:hypothetical protein
MNHTQLYLWYHLFLKFNRIYVINMVNKHSNIALRMKWTSYIYIQDDLCYNRNLNCSCTIIISSDWCLKFSGSVHLYRLCKLFDSSTIRLLKFYLFLPFRQISIFSKGNHIGWRLELSQTILKMNWSMIIFTQFNLVVFEILMFFPSKLD